MPLPNSLLLSVSATLTHPYDFTFYRNSGEIANRIRADLEKEGPSRLKDVTIDSDNDIVVKTNLGNFYVTPTGVTTSGWLTQLKNILAAMPKTSEYSRVLDFLAGVSSSIKADSHSVRLPFRFTPENGLDLLKPRIIDTALQTILVDKAPRELVSFENNVGFVDERGFINTLE